MGRLNRGTAFAGAGVLLAAGAVAAALWGPRSWRLPGMPPYSPGASVIFISVDALRADHLGCYGYERATSPNIDALAAESLLFENHFVTMTHTLPSHTSMFTGLHPRSHGVMRNGVKLDPSLRTLPMMLREAGYATAGITSSFILNRVTGFGRGFDHYADVERARGADHLLSRTLQWLKRNRDEKFFLFLHFMDPHKSYKPPPKYRKWGRDKVSMYDGEVLHVDEAVGELIGYLKRAGVYDRSVIVLTSDHGESLGRGGYYDHQNSLYDECLRAPLIVRLPAGAGPGPGRVGHLTSSVDLLPTLLGLLGIRERPKTQGLDILGRAIQDRSEVYAQRRLIEGQDAPEKPGTVPTANFEYGDKYAVRGRDRKYILRTRGESEFYDLAADPGETRNLLPEPARREEAARWRGLIESWQAATPARSRPAEKLDEGLREKLRSLGYVN